MDDGPGMEDNTIRQPLQTGDVASARTPDIHPTEEGGAESTDGSQQGDISVRSEPLRLSAEDSWHVVTQTAADAIYDIRRLFSGACPELLAMGDATNLLRAIYHPVANALDALNAELDDIFVNLLGFEPRHYRWALDALQDRQGWVGPPAPPVPTQAPPSPGVNAQRATPSAPTPRGLSDIDMEDAASTASSVAHLTDLSASAPPTRPATPASQNSRASGKKKKQDKGKGKARETSPPPSLTAEPMRKRQRANTSSTSEWQAPPPDPHCRGD